MADKKLWAVLYTILAVGVASVTVTYIASERREADVFAEESQAIEETVDSTESESDYESDMPCVNPKAFKEFYESYSETAEDVGEESETSEEPVSTTEPSTEVVESTETAPETEVETIPEARSYSIGKDALNEDIVAMLFEALDRHNIGYWREGALVQCFQESQFCQYAVSDDGRDYGIMQFRAEYWADTSAQYGYEGADIYDMYVQFDIYATQMATRFNSGLSVDEAISRHKTSDEVTTVDWQYVWEVKRWLSDLQEH